MKDFSRRLLSFTGPIPIARYSCYFHVKNKFYRVLDFKQQSEAAIYQSGMPAWFRKALFEVQCARKSSYMYKISMRIELHTNGFLEFKPA
ncbi:MAG: hypothetical protein LHW64_06650 [Candidatus Cloacimonetes bacterium]|nr:hypothetical protein [Candidatus Cloacimonadota bacterium]MCB5287464.1 hypothetical protein [Candidatus Cloacimonadota bacterium]MCK9184896.1 hypothetical protein [Candidatus Cloacimonadota bacterium]MDY0229785.1 hypothetical protein [Candidatus Cloacimonadaceae bacterium]